MNTLQEILILAMLALALFFIAVPYCYVIWNVFVDWLELAIGPAAQKLRAWRSTTAVVRARSQRRRNLPRLRHLAQPVRQES